MLVGKCGRFGKAYLAWMTTVVFAAVTIVLWLFRSQGAPPESSAPAAPLRSKETAVYEPPSFVGAVVCSSCHAREDALWRASNHQRAMQIADASTVLGAFDESTFTYGGVTSRFSRRDGKFIAETDGPDGAIHEYEVAYTFGVAPLQQYLIALPGGRLQALGIAWDSRPRADGGQRWFHLYPNEKITSRDSLHWTGLFQNWNGTCADCHSTHVRKSYDAATRTYATSNSEISVACEACHGPGSLHVAWARREGDWKKLDADKGLPVQLDERHGVAWARDEATGRPRRSTPRASQREIDMCARCHSRRRQVHEDDVHGQPIGDDYRVALLDPDLYQPDGQIRGEVYEYGSFLQSRMFAEGVTCGDCHEPHRPELRGSDNGLCLRCHAQAYDTPKHHFHPQESPGARCISCHMPAVVYMVVDTRRDHGFRVPRPDSTVKLGIPNTCNGCHANRSASWAAKTVERWYGHQPTGRQRFAEAFAASQIGSPDAPALLASVIEDLSQPSIARASALERMAPFLTPATLTIVRGALSDADALVRRGAIRALAGTEPNTRAALIAPLLDDPIRAVRFESTAVGAGIPLQAFSPEARPLVDRAIAEYSRSLELEADRPEAHLELALLDQARLPDRVEDQLELALELEPSFVPAAINLADWYRAQRRDRDGERLLRQTRRHVPNDSLLIEALSLTLVRERRMPEARKILETAVRADPDNARLGYLYGIALHDQGDWTEGVRVLERVLRRHPFDRGTLSAIAEFEREAGRPSRAAEYESRLQALVRRSEPR